MDIYIDLFLPIHGLCHQLTIEKWKLFPNDYELHQNNGFRRIFEKLKNWF